MKIDLNQVIKDIDGNEIKNGDVLITYKLVCEQALLAVSEKNPDISEKQKRFDLYLKVHSDSQEYSAEEVAHLKKLTGEMCTTLMMGLVHKHLEATSKVD